MSAAKESSQSPRPQQQAPFQMIERLLRVVRSQFCRNADDKTWFKDHYHFVKRNVVMWPAHEICSKHGFTLTPERYERIMLEIFRGIETNGQVSTVRYWPGYLMKCVQSHWEHHWEEYYAEAKSVRNATETALLALGRLDKREDRGIEAVGLAHQILSVQQKRRRKQNSHTQLSLFGKSQKG